MHQRPHRSVWVKRNKFKTVGWTQKTKKNKTKMQRPNNVLKDASQTQTRRRDQAREPSSSTLEASGPDRIIQTGEKSCIIHISGETTLNLQQSSVAGTKPLALICSCLKALGCTAERQRVPRWKPVLCLRSAQTVQQSETRLTI